MMDFEIIDKDEFEKASGGVTTPSSAPPEGQLHLEWCEFCKDYYITEYHFGDREGVNNDGNRTT